MAGVCTSAECAASQEDTSSATSPSNSQTRPPTPDIYLLSNFLNLAMADRKKKDRYAGAAYVMGGNSALGQTGGNVPPAAAGYGAPGYGAPAPQAPAYGQPAPATYGAPASPGYGAAPAYGQPDPNALNQQFGQMNINQGQPAALPQQPTAATQQNQLFPSDLIAQPFVRSLHKVNLKHILTWYIQACIRTLRPTSTYPPALQCCRYSLRICQ